MSACLGQFQHHVIQLKSITEVGQRDKNLSSARTDTTPGDRKPCCLLSLWSFNADLQREGGVQQPPFPSLTTLYPHQKHSPVSYLPVS